MEINYIDLKSIVDKQSDSEKLLKTFDNYIKGCSNSAIKYDIICSLFRQRRCLHLKNKELVKFINKFKPAIYCVYKLLKDGVIVYVGSSKSIESRIVTHKKDKDFNEVVVCTKDTKEEMLNLENALIDKLKPEYNKSANISRVRLYGADPCEEEFVRLEDFLIELPIRKNSGNILYTLFEGHSFKYPYGKLNTNGKHTIPAYFVQEGNTVLDTYLPSGVNKIVKGRYGNRLDINEIHKNDEGFFEETIEDILKERDLYKYVKCDTPMWNQNTFDNKFLFTSRQWRVIGRDKWYVIHDKNRFVDILQEHIDSKYGEIHLEKDPIFSFGKYRNKKVSEIITTDPNYIEWCLKSLEYYELVRLGLKGLEDQECIFESAYDRLYTKQK